MKILKFFLIAAVCLNCAGCFQADSNLKITDDGAVTMKNKFVGVPYIAGIIEETKNNLLKNYPDSKVRNVSQGGFSGYEVEIFFPNMEKFAANNFEMYQARPGKCTGVQISNGFFYDTCNFDLLFEGREIDDNYFSESMAQAFFAQIKFDFAVELPYAAESSNADLMTNDGKFLTWNIAPALINGQDKFIKWNFKIYHPVRIAATFFIVLLIIAGVIYNLNQAKIREIGKVERDEEKNPNP